jgi:hypothetical protein
MKSTYHKSSIETLGNIKEVQAPLKFSFAEKYMHEQNNKKMRYANQQTKK